MRFVVNKGPGSLLTLCAVCMFLIAARGVVAQGPPILTYLTRDVGGTTCYPGNYNPISRGFMIDSTSAPGSAIIVTDEIPSGGLKITLVAPRLSSFTIPLPTPLGASNPCFYWLDPYDSIIFPGDVITVPYTVAAVPPGTDFYLQTAEFLPLGLHWGNWVRFQFP